VAIAANVVITLVSLVILFILFPLGKRCYEERASSDLGGRVYDIFQIVAAIVIFAMVAVGASRWESYTNDERFERLSGIHAEGLKSLANEIKSQHSDLTVQHREFIAAINRVLVDVAVLKSKHESGAPVARFQVTNPQDGYYSPILAEIVSVETDPQYEPPEFEGGAVGVRFSRDTLAGRVSVTTMMVGVISSARPDRDPDFENRFEIAIDHDRDDGRTYQSYYGLLSAWSPRLQDVIDSSDVPNLDNLVGTRVELGELLGWVERGSAISLRLGLREIDGKPINPLEAIRGFPYSETLKVED
jgi:hypothetical protein